MKNELRYASLSSLITFQRHLKHTQKAIANNKPQQEAQSTKVKTSSIQCQEPKPKTPFNLKLWVLRERKIIPWIHKKKSRMKRQPKIIDPRGEKRCL